MRETAKPPRQKNYTTETGQQMSAVLEVAEIGLNTGQYAIYIAVIESLLRVRTPAQMLQWARVELQQIFPHGAFIFRMGRIGSGGFKDLSLLSSGFTIKHLQAIRQSEGELLSLDMGRWIKEQKPQLFEEDFARTDQALNWCNSFQKYQLGNIAVHGIHDPNSNITSYFNFSRIPGKLTPYHAYLLELLVPHMHFALIKVLPQAKSRTRKSAQGQLLISLRQREILRWIQQGKTSWEIAQILNITEKTVRNHVQNALIKLRVKNRAQAVDKAKSLNMLEST